MGNDTDRMRQLVAAQFCVGVIGESRHGLFKIKPNNRNYLGMYHSGIGGGGFMLVRASNGSYEFIDFRETAPAAAFEDMYEHNKEGSIHGGLAR